MLLFKRVPKILDLEIERRSKAAKLFVQLVERRYDLVVKLFCGLMEGNLVPSARYQLMKAMPYVQSHNIEKRHWQLTRL
jgi:hypothetical protein